MTHDIKIQNVAHVVFEGFTTIDMYEPVQAFTSCRGPNGGGGWLRHGFSEAEIERITVETPRRILIFV